METLIVDIFVDRSRALRPDEPEKWTARLDGEILVERVRDPEHSTCRVLSARGITGLIAFRHAHGTIGLTMDIERGARLTTVETSRGGWETRNYRAFPPTMTQPTANRVAVGKDVPAPADVVPTQVPKVR